MKKLLPFIFPLIALVIVMFLAVRWYQGRTSHSAGQVSATQFGEGEKIEDLSQAEANKLRQPVKDLSTVTLQSPDNSASDSGQLRYEIQNGKVYFSVIANLPDPGQAFYQVWLKDVNGNSQRKAFRLQAEKGGYIGNAAVSASLLPFQVVVTRQTQDTDQMETVVLQGTIQKDANSTSNSTNGTVQ